MPTEDELRGMLGGAPGHAASIDTAGVIRRSARRRTVRQVAAGGVTTLAVVGIGVAGFTGLRTHQTSSASSAASSASPQALVPQDESQGSQKRAPAEKINLCGGTLAEVAPDASGLTLAVTFPADADASADSITGSVTMTNTGTTAVTGTTAPSAAITLSQGGVVLWHSNGVMIMMAALVDLAPGASMTYPASFSPVRCSTEDEADGFRSDLPHVAPGEYDVSAAIDLSRTDAAGAFVSNDLITGGPTGIRLN
jgi:hypothetical protein